MQHDNECLPGVSHLANLNLFRESDGTLQLTVAMADGAMIEFNVKMRAGTIAGTPIDYIENLIVIAGDTMAARRKRDTRRNGLGDAT